MDPHSRCRPDDDPVPLRDAFRKAADKAGDAAYEAAAGLFNLGLWKQASESYKEYFAKHPRHPLAAHGHFGLGLCYFNLKDYAAAAKELSLAAKGEGPSKVESNLYLGQSLLLKTPSAPKPAEVAFRNSLQALGFERTGIISRTWDRKSIDAWLKKNTDKNSKPSLPMSSSVYWNPVICKTTGNQSSTR